MTSPSSNLVHFTQFKKNVYDDALAILKKSDLEYVQYVQEHMKGCDPASVVNRKPTKTLPKKCQEVLEALVSYELEMEQVTRCLEFLSVPCPFPNTVCTQGQWAEFHFTAWMNLTYSWQEKGKLLVKRVCRWKKLGSQTPETTMREFGALWANFNDVRGRYVHKTGAVPGISEGPGWELCVASRLDVAALPDVRLYTSAIARQQSWSDCLFDCTVKLLENLEAFFAQLNKSAFPS